MLLVSFTLDGTTTRISNETCKLEHQWRNRISSFSPLQFRTPSRHGGYAKMSGGSMSISPDVFADHWPPPVELTDLVIAYTATTEAAAVTLITGRAYRRSYDREEVTYDIYPPQYSMSLLAEDLSYDNETVALPRAFGTVTHVTPIRLPDSGGKPTYHKGYIASAVIGTDWDVYEDGVNVNADVTDNGDGTFSLDDEPTGAITMSGIGQDGTLDTIMDWGCGQYLQGTYPGLHLTYNNTKKRDPGVYINHWASSQMLLIDFLDKIAKYGSHLVYILGSTLYLVDLKQSNGTFTVSRLYPPKYQDDVPVSLIRSNWQTRAVVTEGIGTYVKTYDHEATRKTAYPYGNEEAFSAYHDVAIYVKTAQMDALTYLLQPRVEVEIPIEGDLIVPGQLVSFTDTALRQATSYSIYARSIRYYFDPDKSGMVIIGETQITASNLPVKAGMIFPYNSVSDDIPDGWSKYVGVKDRFIVGHGTDHSSATIGGSTTVEFNSSSDGAHAGDNDDYFAGSYSSGSQDTVFNYGSDPANHSHDLTVVHEPDYQNLCFIQANMDLAELPAHVVVLMDSNDTPSGLTPVFAAGKLLRGSTDSIATGGGGWSGDTQSAVAGHKHIQAGGAPADISEIAYYYILAGAHANHVLTLTITNKLKKVYLRAYTSTSAFEFTAGMIGFIDILTIPDGCVVCDGDNGTPDCEDRYIVLSSDATTANDGSQELGLSGTLANVSHHHQGDTVGETVAPEGYQVTVRHANNEAHGHTVSGDVSWEPPHYPLLVAMKAA